MVALGGWVFLMSEVPLYAVNASCYHSPSPFFQFAILGDGRAFSSIHAALCDAQAISLPTESKVSSLVMRA